MYFKRSIEVWVGQQYSTSYHTFDSIETLLVLVFLVVFDVFGKLRELMEREAQSALPRVTVEVDHTDKLTQLFASFWNCEGLNGLDFLWYGHNSVKSDMITQIVKFVGTKA